MAGIYWYPEVWGAQERHAREEIVVMSKTNRVKQESQQGTALCLRYSDDNSKHPAL